MSRLCSPVVTDHTTFFNGQSAKRRVPVSLRVGSSHPSASRIATYTRDACLAVLAPGRCLGRGREGKPIAPTVQHRQLGQFMIKRSSWLRTSTRAYHAHFPSRQLEPLSLHESINDSKCPVPGFDNFTRPLVSLASFAAPGLVTPGSRQEDAGRGRPRHFMPGLYVIRRCASVCVEVGASATHALQIARISCARICVTILNVA